MAPEEVCRAWCWRGHEERFPCLRACASFSPSTIGCRLLAIGRYRQSETREAAECSRKTRQEKIQHRSQRAHFRTPLLDEAAARARSTEFESIKLSRRVFAPTRMSSSRQTNSCAIVNEMRTMNKFQMGNIEPRLNATEELAYHAICNLHRAQVSHRFHDPEMPPHPDIEVLDTFEAKKAAIAAWSETCREHRIKRGPTDPRPHASLFDLWGMIDPPDSLQANRTTQGDLLFDDFALCQRDVNEKRSPAGWLPRWYIVAIPISTRSFRCVAKEASGRTFCTTAMHSSCRAPAQDDFRVVRVSGMGTIVMQLYLPGTYGDWQIITQTAERVVD